MSSSDRCDRNRSFDWPWIVCRLYYWDQASDQHCCGTGLEQAVELAANFHYRPVADVRIADLQPLSLEIAYRAHRMELPQMCVCSAFGVCANVAPEGQLRREVGFWCHVRVTELG